MEVEPQGLQPPQQQGVSFPVKKVVLYKHGVGYFERKGEVTGRATIQLSFKASEMNDVLKSLTVLDLGDSSSAGTISSISYEAPSSSSTTSTTSTTSSFSNRGGDSARSVVEYGGVGSGGDASQEGGGGEFDLNLARCYSLAELLGRLKGIRVLCSLKDRANNNNNNNAQQESVEGVVVSAEEIEDRRGGRTSILTLLVEGRTFRSLNMDSEIATVQLLDDSVVGGLQAALNGHLGAMKRDRKKITIFAEPSSQEGEQHPRPIVVSYVVQSPVWKTSYRALLFSPKSEKGKEKVAGDCASSGIFQGWALVDNTQDEDWEGVELSLVAGKPISFRQDLYHPLTTRRPRIPTLVSVTSGVSGGRDTQSLISSMLQQSFSMQPIRQKRKRIDTDTSDSDAYDDGDIRKRKRARRNLRSQSRSRSRRRGAARDRRDRSRSIGDRDKERDRDRDRGSAAERTTKVAVDTRAPMSGDLFSYDIKNPVTVKRHQSGLVPILQEPFTGERVAMYNPETHPEYPLSTLYMVNNTGMTLEGGPLTVMEDDMYVGEALLETTKPGERRFIKFAVELGIIVTPQPPKQDAPQTLHIVTVEDSNMELSYLVTSVTTYKVENRNSRDTVLYLEHAKTKLPYPYSKGGGDWDFCAEESSAVPEYSTNRFHGFRFNVAANSSLEFHVAERRIESRTLQLSSMSAEHGTVDGETIRDWKRRKFIDEVIYQKLDGVIDLNDKMRALEDQISQLKRQQDNINSDQARIRGNLQAVTVNTDQEGSLRKRYVAQLARQEDTLIELKSKIKQLDSQVSSHARDLKNLVAGLKFEIILAH